MRYTFFPKWVGNNGIVWGIMAILVSALVFSSRMMPLHLYVFFFVEVAGFFYYSQHLSRSWARYTNKKFISQLFWVGLALRIPWTIYTHINNVSLYGELYCYNLPDIEVYVGLPYEAVQNIIERGDWDFLGLFMKWLKIDDLGAPVLNTFLLLLTGNTQPCLVPLIANIIMGAYTSVFVYRIAQRHFGEDVARMTALFCMLNPNLIWWCSSLMKEIQMTFFTFWFLDRMDDVLYGGKESVTSIASISLIGMLVFLYRAALGILLFLAFFVALALSGDKTLNRGRKIFTGAIVVLVLMVGLGEQMREQASVLYEQAGGDYQKKNMAWRVERDGGGNIFARYAGAAVFAPLVFTLPFPTVSYTFEAQEMLMEVAGGNFIKNVLSFFVIMCLIMMFVTGEWRQHIFPIAYLLGYLIILVFSVYAQSGRFHVPALPIEMMFAAYCIKLIDQGRFKLRRIYKKTNCKRWFSLWCIGMFAACIFWQWFKLRGQGLI